MRTTKSVEKIIEVIDDVLCNKCGKTCMLSRYPHGLIDAKVHGGYSSEAINDGDLFKFDICEKCFKELSETFVIPAKVGNSWFPEDNEEDAKNVQDALDSLKSSLKEVATVMKDNLKEGGFIKFGDQMATKIGERLEDLKEKMK